MPHQIRRNVFETNSSSSHSLTLSQSDLVPQPFATDVLRAGVVMVGKAEYGWEWHRYYSAVNKLSYLLTQVAQYDDVPEGDPERVTELMIDAHPQLRSLVDAVREHTGVELRFTPGSTGYIDHDSVGVGSELLGDSEALRQFLFSDAYVETGNDNTGPGWTIQTDRGEELYYGELIAPEVPAAYVPMTLYTLKHYGDQGFATGSGGLVKPEADPELYDAVLAQSVLTSVHWLSEGNSSHLDYEEIRGYTARALQRLSRDEAGPHLKVAANFIATKEKLPGEGWDVNGRLVVQMPRELATRLNALDPSGHRKYLLAQARRELKFWAGRLKESPGDRHTTKQVARYESLVRKFGGRVVARKATTAPKGSNAAAKASAKAGKPTKTTA